MNPLHFVMLRPFTTLVILAVVALLLDNLWVLALVVGGVVLAIVLAVLFGPRDDGPTFR